MKKYTAFISYRHREPDHSVATRLHRMIEHFRVPKDLRKDGRKRLGRVFRDQDELPLSTDLGESIRYAIDNSDFLIAVCTPEYPKSKWCMEELDSFIALWGRDRVLAVLAEGTPEESFPAQLLHSRDEAGNEIAVEPLAANVAAPTRRKSLRKLNTEKLRIIASILDCPFDTLYQREKRYRKRRILAAAALVLVIGAVFAGMVLRKNAQVRAQEEESRKNRLQAQLNESVFLTESARNDLLRGRKSSAFRTLLKAVPEDPDQPYDVSAEGALADALAVYGYSAFRFSSNIEQDSAIEAWTTSADGEQVFTWDSFGVLRAWSAGNGQLLWQRQLAEKPTSMVGEPLVWCDEIRGVLCFSSYRAEMISAADGTLLWEVNPNLTEWYPVAGVPGRNPGELLLVGRTTLDRSIVLNRMDIRTGEVRQSESIPLSGEISILRDFSQLETSGRYAYILDQCMVDSEYWWHLLLIDTESMQAKHIPLEKDEILSVDVQLCLTPGGMPVVSVARRDGMDVTVRLQVFDPITSEISFSAETTGNLRGSMFVQSCVAGSDEYAMVGVNNSMYGGCGQNPGPDIKKNQGGTCSNEALYPRRKDGSCQALHSV